ncbi:MAG: 30S ribosomal protein S18 [Candidatus Pelagibacter sp.]|nr:30S ribosomal protein S18 [Candidatus Pelagibacter sp.]OUW24160.1 MAG: 30S ribosomal protein S18 [Rickettsiales bacterium TMED174]|tara:strand:- start:1133 stop:1405 length:273 start_codon:yes stop_codon:yes gene_type:complete
MKSRKTKFNKRGQSPLAKLSLFQKNDLRFSKKCPFSKKNAEVIDYKNVKLLRRYLTENNKILSSKITSVSQGSQRKLAAEIKKAKILGLI